MELAYPFGLLELMISIVKGYNVDLLIKLTECLHFQIINMCLEEPLVKCLVKIFHETDAYL